ncbi:glycosyltransferase family 4 protein [Hahella sp. SMD15-11]|uniref:Glycosyltransferase family 4 protein n=1 Tax=Thermohahella caldifontis TaxID=3142973 RepID=A0AB39UV36_9GAMM
MKIALIRQQFRVDGGAERMVMNTLSALSGEDTEFTVIAHKWEKSPEQRPEIRFLEARRTGWSRLRKQQTFTQSVRELLRQNTFDIVQSFERIPGVPVYRAGDGVHATWLEQKQRMEGPLTRFWTRHDPFHRYLLRQEQALYQSPELKRVICISNMVKADLKNRFDLRDDQLTLVYNGVDLERFRPASPEERQQLRQELGLPQAACLALFMGSGFKRKGLSLLLEALASVPDAVHLVICGQDKHRKHYESLAHALGLQHRVYFRGPVRQPERYYQCADILVHPAWYEPFGNVVLESLACGTGVITTCQTGAHELISGSHGVILETGNTEALSEALRQALDHCKTWRPPARLTAEEYGLDRMATSLRRLYQELLRT